MLVLVALKNLLEPFSHAHALTVWPGQEICERQEIQIVLRRTVEDDQAVDKGAFIGLELSPRMPGDQRHEQRRGAVVTQDLGTVDRVHTGLANRCRITDVVQPRGGEQVVAQRSQIRRHRGNALDMEPPGLVGLEQSTREVLGFEG